MGAQAQAGDIALVLALLLQRPAFARHQVWITGHR